MPNAEETKKWPKIADLAVDICLFSFNEQGLPKVLLGKRGGETFHGYWAVPGGYVDDGELLIDAAYRELEEETGLTKNDVTLIRLDIRDGVDRDPRGRTISIVYGAFVSAEAEEKAAHGSDLDDVDWKHPAADDFPRPLAFDHDDVIRISYLSLLQLEATHVKFPAIDLGS